MKRDPHSVANAGVVLLVGWDEWAVWENQEQPPLLGIHELSRKVVVTLDW
jgi:hypothetical protein